MIYEFPLRTRAKDGTDHTFLVREEPRFDGCGWDYKILSARSDGDPFDLSVVLVEPGLLQVDAVNHYGNPEFKGMGIPEALYVAIARQKQCALRSSPTQHSSGPDGGEWITKDGVAVWRRLVARGEAHFDVESGRWVLPLPK